MQQIYHSNAKTNVNIRLQIQTHSYNSNDDLANQFGISAQTVSKWKNRNFTQDASCRPHHIYYCLPDIQQTLIVSIRKASWLALDEIWEMLLAESDRFALFNFWNLELGTDCLS